MHRCDNAIPFELFGWHFAQKEITRSSESLRVWVVTVNGICTTPWDPAEQHDLRNQMPALFLEMVAEYQEYEKAQNIVPVNEAWNPFENVK